MKSTADMFEVWPRRDGIDVVCGDEQCKWEENVDAPAPFDSPINMGALRKIAHRHWREEHREP